MLQPATSPYRVVADVAVYDTEQRKEKVTTDLASEVEGRRGRQTMRFRQNFWK
jgi:hypothetical protein